MRGWETERGREGGAVDLGLGGEREEARGAGAFGGEVEVEAWGRVENESLGALNGEGVGLEAEA